MTPGMDMTIRSLANLGRASEDERAKRLEEVIHILSVCRPH